MAGGSPIRFHIWWSVYVRCKNMQKFRRVHLPAIEARVGVPEMGWEIGREPDNPNETRMVTYTNHEASSKDEGAALLAGLAGRLYAGRWELSGLSTLTGDCDLYLFAQASAPQSSHEPPALTEMLLELQTGWVRLGEDGWEMPDDRTT